MFNLKYNKNYSPPASNYNKNINYYISNYIKYLSINEIRFIKKIYEVNEISNAELIKALHISKPTLIKIKKHCIDLGLITVNSGNSKLKKSRYIFCCKILTSKLQLVKKTLPVGGLTSKQNFTSSGVRMEAETLNNINNININTSTNRSSSANSNTSITGGSCIDEETILKESKQANNNYNKNNINNSLTESNARSAFLKKEFKNFLEDELFTTEDIDCIVNCISIDYKYLPVIKDRFNERRYSIKSRIGWLIKAVKGEFKEIFENMPKNEENAQVIKTPAKNEAILKDNEKHSIKPSNVLKFKKDSVLLKAEQTQIKHEQKRTEFDEEVKMFYERPPREIYHLFREVITTWDKPFQIPVMVLEYEAIQLAKSGVLEKDESENRNNILDYK